MSYRVSVLLLLLGSLPVSDTPDFDRDVRPLLSDRCFMCHGPDGAAREADLRLDLRDAAIEAGAIVPGDPDASLLIQRIHAPGGEAMPPPESKLSLSDDERAILREWIASGAEYEAHWAFEPIGDPAPPEGKWGSDPLDSFIEHRLREAGRVPAPEAARATWLRRASFAATGLPPTPEEIDAFEANSAPDAYEQEVDRLLASPRYGERMAADWLDLARYADTYGYQADVYREVWPWRDWVIESFQQNQPFDEFVTWQLAGDMLPNATTEQRLATAFNRLHRQTNEGGSVEEEYRLEYIGDRLHTFGTAFLGLTLECSRCHDHKYDPISQREYYGLAGLFGNIDESGLYSHFTNAVPTPTVELPTEQQETELARLAEVEIEDEVIDETGLFHWRNMRDPLSPPPGLVALYAMEGEGRSLPSNVGEVEAGTMHGANSRVPREGGHGIQLTGDDALHFPAVGHFRRWDPFTISLWLKPGQERERSVVFHRSRAWHDSGSRGYQLLLEEGKPSFSLIHFWPGDALRVIANEPVPVEDWSHVTVTYDGSSRAAGVHLYVNGLPIETTVVRDHLTRKIVGSGESHLTIGERFRDKGFKGGAVDELAVFTRELAAAEVRGWALGSSEWTEEELRDVYLARPESPALAKRKEHRKQVGELRDRIKQVMGMEELPGMRDTHLLFRGEYLNKRELVEPHLPAVLPAHDGPLDRLALAGWLTREDHPLFARVAVNRLWQLAFGRGLVSTPENFGIQGARPSHPELLDRLARDFMESDFDVKAMWKRMLLSSTFRQQSGTHELDPENELLGFGPSHRLSAEMLRDQALFASGLLVEKVGGPSVKPYQPAGLWKEKSGKTYNPDKGEGLYRRSLYTIWKRTSPPPGMMVLDASKRDVCVAQRRETTSALQALLYWNDPGYVEAGRVLAARCLGTDRTDEERVEELWRRLTGERPTGEQAERVLALVSHLRSDFSEDEAREYLAVGESPPLAESDPVELAAWSLTATTLLSTHAVTHLR